LGMNLNRPSATSTSTGAKPQVRSDSLPVQGSTSSAMICTMFDSVTSVENPSTLVRTAPSVPGGAPAFVDTPISSTSIPTYAGCVPGAVVMVMFETMVCAAMYGPLASLTWMPL